MQTAKEMAVRAVARSFGGWVARDLDIMSAGLSDDFIQWHSHIGRNFSKTEHQAMLVEVLKHAVLDYHDIDYLALGSGEAVLVRCLCDVRVNNGGSVRDVPFALIFHLRDGKIHRCDEYMDGASLPDMSFLAADEAD